MGRPLKKSILSNISISAWIDGDANIQPAIIKKQLSNKSFLVENGRGFTGTCYIVPEITAPGQLILNAFDVDNNEYNVVKITNHRTILKPISSSINNGELVSAPWDFNSMSFNNDVILDKIKPDTSDYFWWEISESTNYEVFYSSVVYDNKGNLYVSGSANNQTGDTSRFKSFSFIKKFNPTGSLLWIRVFTSNDTLTKSGDNLLLDNNGEMYLSTVRNPNIENSESVSYVIKINKFGNIVWQTALSESASHAANIISLASGTDNSIYGCAQVNAKMVVFKLNKNTGAILFDKTFSYQTYLEPTKIVVDLQNNALVTGASDDGSSGSQFLIKLSPTGTTIWQKLFTSHMFGTGIAVDSDNNIYATGYKAVTQPTTEYNSILIKLDSDGDEIFQKIYRVPRGSPFMQALLYTPKNQIHISGSLILPGNTTSDLIFMTMNPDGTPAWARSIIGRDVISQTPYQGGIQMSHYDKKVSVAGYTLAGNSSQFYGGLVAQLPTTPDHLGQAGELNFSAISMLINTDEDPFTVSDITMDTTTFDHTFTTGVNVFSISSYDASGSTSAFHRLSK